MKNYCLRTGFVVVGLVVVGTLLLAACGSQSTALKDKQKASLGATIVMANAALNHSPNGTADLSWDPASQKLIVKLQISGLAPRSVHPVDIYSGPCPQPGDIKYALANLVAGVSGVANSTTTLENVKNDLSQVSWSINVHNGASAQPGMQRLIISCADIQNAPKKTQGQGIQNVHIVLGAAYAANEQASGVAQLRLVDNSLSVTVTMTGLTPKSVHAASIYTGSCEAQGGIAYSLKPISADSQGNGTSVTELSGVNHLPAHGWYINVHLAGASSVHMENDSIACGNVQTAG